MYKESYTKAMGCIKQPPRPEGLKDMSHLCLSLSILVICVSSKIKQNLTIERMGVNTCKFMKEQFDRLNHA